MVQAIVTLLLPISPIFDRPTYAAAPFQDVFYYPSDADTPGAVEDMLTSFTNMRDGSGNPKPVMNSTYVDIMGGPFGANPQELEFDSGGTSPSNFMAYHLNNGQGYDCYVDGSGTAQLSIPNNAVYWHIDYDMYVHYDLTSSPPTFTTRERIAKVDKIMGPNPAVAAAGGAGGAALQKSVSDSNANGLGHPELDSGGSGVGLPSQCLPDPNYFSHHLSFNSALPNYYQNQPAWPNITANPGGVGGGPGGAGSTDACDSNAVSLGWLLCPIINLAHDAIHDIITGVVIPELQVQPLDPTTTNGKNQYVVWNNIRTLADVLFVIIFLVMIFANTLQFNLNAYTIKKVIPKLVAAAILVQFSFVIGEVLIDLGNILGNGVGGLVGNVKIGTVNNNPAGGADSTLNALGVPFDALLGASLIAIIGVPTILVAMLTALIAAVGVLFTVIARRLILVILVILAPLAFAAWVLPGTEKYFNMWLKTFIRTVLMYPMIIFLLSAASLASATINDGSQIEGLLAAVLPIIAFFMIPMTFKWAGSAMSMAAGGINKVTNRASSSGAMKGLRSGAKERQQRINQDRAAGYQNTVFGRNVPGARRVMTGIGRLGRGQIIPGITHTKSDIAQAAQKAMAEESKRVEALNLDRKVLAALATGNRASLTNKADQTAYDQNKSLAKTYTGRAAIANQLAKKGNVEGLEGFRKKLNDDVVAKRLPPAQATQLWNGAKAGAFNEIKGRDPIMAVSGWADGEYDGTMMSSTTPGTTKLQESMSRLSGDDIANIADLHLDKYAAGGATLSSVQLKGAVSDKARVGKTAAHQGHVLRMAQQGSAATDPSVQFERLLRFDHSSGAPVARDDTTVDSWRRKYATDAGYRATVNAAVTAGHDVPPPP